MKARTAVIRKCGLHLISMTFINPISKERSDAGEDRDNDNPSTFTDPNRTWSFRV